VPRSGSLFIIERPCLYREGDFSSSRNPFTKTPMYTNVSENQLLMFAFCLSLDPEGHLRLTKSTLHFTCRFFVIAIADLMDSAGCWGSLKKNLTEFALRLRSGLFDPKLKSHRKSGPISRTSRLNPNLRQRSEDMKIMDWRLFGFGPR